MVGELPIDCCGNHNQINCFVFELSPWSAHVQFGGHILHAPELIRFIRLFV